MLKNTVTSPGASATCPRSSATQWAAVSTCRRVIALALQMKTPEKPRKRRRRLATPPYGDVLVFESTRAAGESAELPPFSPAMIVGTASITHRREENSPAGDGAMPATATAITSILDRKS